MAKSNSFFPNVMHNDKWKLTFSNIPTLSDISDMRYFDNYVKNCTLPAYTIGEIISQLPFGFQVRHPLGGMKKNQDLGSLSISFKVSEDMYNYMVFFSWIQQLRYGEISSDHHEYFRLYTIKVLALIMMDNQKRPVATIKFTNLFLSDLGELPLTYGSTEELTFNCTFTYEEIKYEMINPMVGGSDMLAPTNIIECGTSGVPNDPTLVWSK